MVRRFVLGRRSWVGFQAKLMEGTTEISGARRSHIRSDKNKATPSGSGGRGPRDNEALKVISCTAQLYNK